MFTVALKLSNDWETRYYQMDARKKRVTKNQNILIKMVGRKCVLESHSSSLKQPNKYVCGVVMKLGNSFVCVFQILQKRPQIYCLCHNGKAKGYTIIRKFLSKFPEGTCYFFTHVKTLELFFIESWLFIDLKSLEKLRITSSKSN